VNPESLVRAFLSGGARRVIAASWDVDALATRRLMTAFYREIARGTAVAEALRRAKVEVRNVPETRHPYYWAAFEVFGVA
jgi:CHAT domain-containing protein